MINNIMKSLVIAVLLFTLVGCESLGEIIREEKYTVQFNETLNSKQSFGYNTDHDYMGFMISGSFGNAPPKHVHSIYCHNPENNSQ